MTNPIVNLSDTEIAQGRCLEDNEKTYLIEAPDGRVEYVPKQGKYQLLVESDEIETLFTDGGSIEFPTFDGFVRLTVVSNDEGATNDYILESHEGPIALEGEEIEEALRALKSDLEVRGDRDLDDLDNQLWDLQLVYEALTEGRVRRDIIDRLADEFDDESVRITDTGWIVADTFIVTYEGENYYLDEGKTYVVNGSEVVAADEAHEALDIEQRIDPSETTVTIEDTEVDLTELETTFLATVEYLLNAQEYLPTRIARDIINAKQTRTVEHPFDESITGMADEMEVTGFTDPYSGIAHGMGGTNHSIDKHTLPDRFNVTQRALDRLKSNWWDHLGVHELAMREEEFRNASYDVFTDTDNNDDNRWADIRQTCDNAPVDDEAHLERLKDELRADPTVPSSMI